MSFFMFDNSCDQKRGWFLESIFGICLFKYALQLINIEIMLMIMLMNMLMWLEIECDFLVSAETEAET